MNHSKLGFIVQIKKCLLQQPTYIAFCNNLHFVSAKNKLYGEVVELAEREEWGELEEKIIRFFVCVLDEKGNRIVTHEDFFLTTDEMIRLGERI